LESVAFDVGSENGEFASQLRVSYGCRVWIFESCPRRYHHCADRFASDPSVACQPFGLGVRDEDGERRAEGDGSRTPKPDEKERVRPFAAFFAESGLRQIDLLKVSSEGGEFALLEELIDNGLINQVVYLQVQFDDYSPDDVARRDRFRQLLARTHVEQWSCPFIWESWRRRRADDRPILHTIGDSHGGGVLGLVGAFDQIADVMHHHLGPKLMHSIGRDGLDLRAYGIADGDTVICCFGEIDCRCHIHKFGADYRRTIEVTVERYMQALLANLARLPQLRLCVYNIPPPIRKAGRAENPDYPYLGTDEERLTYVTYMNILLAEQCGRNGLVFVDIVRNYADAEGFLRPELSDTTVHIVEPGPLLRFIDSRLR
jgi:FkbM family methyltransferase